MTDQTFQLDGQLLAKICKQTLPGHDCMDAGGRAPKVGALGDAGAIAEDDELLVSKLQSLNPDYPIRLAKTGEE